MSQSPKPKHPELSVRISPSEHSFIIIGKVTRALRNSSKHDSIEEFMKQVLIAENDEEFMKVVNKYLTVTNDD